MTLDFALARLSGVIDKLVVYPERMRENLERGGGLVHSQQVLLALTQKGVSREDAYRLVQKNAMRAFRGEGSFLEFLKADPEVSAALAGPSSRRCSICASICATSTRSSRAFSHLLRASSPLMEISALQVFGSRMILSQNRVPSPSSR